MTQKEQWAKKASKKIEVKFHSDRETFEQGYILGFNKGIKTVQIEIKRLSLKVSGNEKDGAKVSVPLGN